MLVDEIRKIKKKAEEDFSLAQRLKQDEYEQMMSNQFYHIFTNVWASLQAAASARQTSIRVFEIPLTDKLDKKEPWSLDNLRGHSASLVKKLNDEGFSIFIEEEDLRSGKHGHIIRHHLVATWR